MKKFILMVTAVFLFAALLPAEAESSTGKKYYVSAYGSDNNTGGADAPFQTLTKALETASGGDTVKLLDDPAGGDILLTGFVYDRPVSVEPYDSGKKIRVGFGLELNGCRNLSLSGFSFCGENAGLSITDSEDSAVSGCDFLSSAGVSVTGGKNIKLTGCAFDGGAGASAAGTDGFGLVSCLFYNNTGSALTLSEVRGRYLDSSGKYGGLWECHFFGSGRNGTGVFMQGCSDFGFEGGQISGYAEAVSAARTSGLYMRRLNIFDCGTACSLTSSDSLNIDCCLLYSCGSYISLSDSCRTVALTDSAFITDSGILNIPSPDYGLYGISESGISVVSPSVHKSIFSFNKAGSQDGLVTVTGIRTESRDGLLCFEPDVNRTVFDIPGCYYNPYMTGRTYISFSQENTADLDDIAVVQDALPLGTAVPLYGDSDDFSRSKDTGVFVSEPFDYMTAVKSLTMRFSLHDKAAVDYLMFYPEISASAVMTDSRTVEITLSETAAVFGDIGSDCITVSGAKNAAFTAERLSYNRVRLTFDKSISSLYKNMTVTLMPQAFIDQYKSILSGRDMLGRSSEELADTFDYASPQATEVLSVSVNVSKLSDNSSRLMTYIVYGAAGCAVSAFIAGIIWYFVRDRLSVSRYVKKGRKAVEKRRLSRKYK